MKVCNSLAGAVVAPLLAALLSVSTNVVVVVAFVVPTTTAPHVTTATRTAAYWTASSWSSSSSSSSTTSLTAVNEKDKGDNDNNEMFANLKGTVTKRVPKDFDISSIIKSFDISSLTENFNDIASNLSSGEFGQRGEAYVLVQGIVLLCIALGSIPVVGGMVSLLLGPGLLLVGLATMAVSLPALGPNLSPWPVPSSSKDSYLVTNEGLYAQLRHPLYAGLLATCVGLSILTGSATRLLLTAFLWYVLDMKSDYEEEELAQKFPEYGQYKKDVPGKFFPKSIGQVMPWSSYDQK